MALAALLAVSPTGAGLAHTDGPPPPPPPLCNAPPPPVEPEVVWVHPARWSWTHWWEANRALYLRPPAQGAAQRMDPDALAEMRRRAADTLIKYLEHPHPRVKQAAMLALGAMQARDRFDAVRGVAETSRWAAGPASVALMQDPRSEAAILDPAIGGTALGLGLLETLSPAGEDRLVRAADELFGLWAIRQHRLNGAADSVRAVARRTTDPELAGVALVTLGAVRDRAGTALLAAVLREDGPRRSLAAGAVLWDQHQDLVRETQRLNVLPRRITLGHELILMARLRASAAIALGNPPRLLRGPQAAPAEARPPDRAAIEALVRLVEEDWTRYSELPKGFALVSLAQWGEPRTLPILLGALDPRRDASGRGKRNEETDSPNRGMAAIALGIYSRPVRTAQGLYDRPGSDRAAEALIARLVDEVEAEEVRAACAVALGIAGRTEYLEPLQRMSRTLTPADELLVGYTLLGRGMLGDRNLIEPAARFLALPEGRPDVSAMLSRRAAVLALGLTGSNEAVPVLTRAWHLSYFVNREVLFALSLAGAKSVSEQIIDEADGSNNPVLLEFMLSMLGQLFGPEPPTALDRLLVGSNYTLKEADRVAVMALGNEFFANFFLPAFSREWRGEDLHDPETPNE